MKFEDLPLDPFRRLLEQASWDQLFVEIGRCEPISEPGWEAVQHFLRHHVGQLGRPLVRTDLTHLTSVERSAAERYIAILLQHELVCGDRRLAYEPASQAATLFLAPFGAATKFYPNISLTADGLRNRGVRPLSGTFGGHVGIIGTTLEEGLFAIDPMGLIGALFVGDED